MPHASERRFASSADEEACARLIEGGSKSFHAASLMMPERIRAGAYALYAFCRLSDDAVDDAAHAAGAAAALDRMRARLDLVFAGRPGASAVDRALADVVRRHAIPRSAFDALIEGLAWDLEGRAYETIDDLAAYGARVAGAVGVMMAALMDIRAPGLVARACDLGVAMQLTNIARDVGADARMGRLYLPRAWMREAGLDPDAWLATPRPCPEIAAVTQRLLLRADRLYERAAPGVAALPLRCRPAIAAAARLYREIGEEVRRRGCDSVTGRAVVSGARKRRLALLAACAALFGSRAGRDAAPLAQTRFLVADYASTAPDAPRSLMQRMDARVGQVFDLFRALEIRDRSPAAP